MRNIESIRPSDEAIDAEFTAERRELVFQEVLRGRTGAVTARSGRRRWPSIAVAAIAGLVLLGLAIQALAPQGDRRAEPTTGISTAPVASPSPPPSVGNLSAAAMLSGVAAAAASAPAAETSAFLHVVRYEEQTGSDGDDSTGQPVTQDVSTTHEDYIDSDGWLWSRRFGDQNFWLLTEQDQGSILSLPVDPDALDAALRSGTGNDSGDERVFKALDEILRTETAPAALRAAAITVLQRIAENPQEPEITKDGDTASPSVAVTLVSVDRTAKTGYRASITDPGSRPGEEFWLVLDDVGQILESGTTDPEFTFSSTITTREWVTALPDDFVEVLGTDHVELLIDG